MGKFEIYKNKTEKCLCDVCGKSGEVNVIKIGYTGKYLLWFCQDCFKEFSEVVKESIKNDL